MSIIQWLGQVYTLSNLSSAIYSTIGPTSIVIAFIAFIGLIGYIASLPTTRTFSYMNSRLVGVKYFDALIGIIGPFVFLWLLFFNFHQVGTVFLLLLVPSLGVIFKRMLEKPGWSYKDFSDLKLGSHPVNSISAMFSSEYPSLRRNLWTGSIVLVALIFDLFIFALTNPSLPLIVWVVVIYLLATIVFQSAYDVGLLNSVLAADYYKVSQEFTEGKKVTEGFVTRKDSDHIFLMTKDGTISLFTSAITEMSHLTPSELVKLNKKVDGERTKSRKSVKREKVIGQRNQKS